MEKEAQLMWATMTEVVRTDYGKEYFDYVMKILQQTAYGGVSLWEVDNISNL